MDDMKGGSRDQNSGSENLKSLEYYKLNLLLVLYFYGQLSLSPSLSRLDCSPTTNFLLAYME
jgi:hypothetical protein